MNNDNCKHIYGFMEENEQIDRVGLIDQPFTQINGYTKIMWFKYCPK